MAELGSLKLLAGHGVHEPWPPVLYVLAGHAVHSQNVTHGATERISTSKAHTPYDNPHRATHTAAGRGAGAGKSPGSAACERNRAGSRTRRASAPSLQSSRPSDRRRTEALQGIARPNRNVTRRTRAGARTRRADGTFRAGRARAAAGLAVCVGGALCANVANSLCRFTSDAGNQNPGVKIKYAPAGLIIRMQLPPETLDVPAGQSDYRNNAKTIGIG